MQFVRTAQFKHKHLLALSTEDGGGAVPRVRSPCMPVLTTDTADHEQVWEPYAVDPYYSAISK